MLRLRTLGGLDLRAEGGEIHSILSQPKRLGLLVYLASAGPHGYRRRDSIVPLFWPELDHERARAALRQAVYVLRRDLGEAAVQARGEEELGVDPAMLWFDVPAFEQAMDGGDPRAASDLYRGDFLEGFFVSGAGPEFDVWVEGERSRLRSRASRAAKAVAETEAERRPAEAAGWIRRAASLAPDDEPMVRWALQLFDRIGDRAGALQLYQEFRDRLAQEYDAQPAAETRSLGEALRRSEEPTERPRGDPVRGPDPTGSVEQPRPEPSSRLTGSRARRRVHLLLPMLAIGIVIAATAMMKDSPERGLDPDRIFALPLHVSGSDSSLNYLREGMLDLLAAKLAGGTGPRLVDPAAAVSAWRAATAEGRTDPTLVVARRLARSAGAGRLLLGAVVGGADRIDLQATLLDVASGRAGKPVMVSGSRDSLPLLVDRLAAGLSVRAAGEEETRLSDLTSRSLPALQAYLAGKQLFRAGEYAASLSQYGLALDLDSTFALAALALAESRGYWGDAASGAGRGLRIAWQWQAKLTPRDREFLHFLVEPNYPGVATLHQKVTNWERAVGRFPDRPVAWFQYGDNLFHWGLQIGIMDAEARAAAAFDRAIALDSNFSPALEHRIWLAASVLDTAALVRVGARYAANSPDAERLVMHRWRVAWGLGDTVALAEIRRRFGSLSTATLGSVVRMSQQEFVSLADAESALAIVQQRASTLEEKFLGLMFEHDLALTRGQPRRARQAILRTKPVEDPNWTDSEDRVLVYDALYADGERAAADTAARILAARAARPLSLEPLARARRYFDLCAAAQWRVAGGDYAYGRQAAARFAATHPPTDRPGDVAEHAICAAMLQVRIALLEGRPAGPAADHLDSLLTFGPWIYSLIRQAAVFTLAEARERQGDIPRALDTVRRRELGLWNHFITTQLRAEGRLAAMAGDTVGAIRAYRRYTVLRGAPDPSANVEAYQVRDALRELE